MIVKSDFEAVLNHIQSKMDPDMFDAVTHQLKALLESQVREESPFYDVDIIFVSSEHIPENPYRRIKEKFNHIPDAAVDFLYLIGVDSLGQAIDTAGLVAFVQSNERYVDWGEIKREDAS